MTEPKTTLPMDSAARKDIPLATGCYDYFPAALAEVARLSKSANDKHNPGEEMHHARGKSMDHADCIARHQTDRGTIDTDGYLHDVKVAWRALAQLQEELERRGAPLARAARLPVPPQAVPRLTSDAMAELLAGPTHFVPREPQRMPPSIGEFVAHAIPITRKNGVLGRHAQTDALENSYGKR